MFVKKYLNMKLLAVSEVKPDISLVYLMNEDSDLSILSLSKTEQTYVYDCFQMKKKLIRIHQYYRWIFILVVENDRSKNEIAEKLRREASNIADFLKEERIKDLQVFNATAEPFYSIAFAEGFLLSQYKFDKYLTKNEKNGYLFETIALINYSNEKDLTVLQNLCEAVYFTRDLINEPSNILNSLYLADIARELALKLNIEIKVFYKSDIEAMNMGGLLSVNRGSVDPPVFIHLEYKPQNYRNSHPLVLVGKGIPSIRAD